jgi:hypothetical protein
MKRRSPHTLVLFAPLLISRLALADASYQESVQITGGQLVETLRSVPFLPKSMKQLLDPLKTTKMVHGNQYASVSPQSTEIIDLDQETVTRIDHDKKTYSVTTFAQMRQALQDSAKKVQQAKSEGAKAQQPAAAAPADTTPASRVQVTFDVSLTDPGVSKVLNGQSAKEQVLTLKAHVTDPNPPADNPVQTVTYGIITDIWTASEPPEVKEVEEFYARYARKLMQGVDMAALLKDLSPSIDGAAVAPLFAKNPGMGPALQEAGKKMATEMAKIKGTPILEITRMGGEGMPAPTGDVPPATPPQPSTASRLGALGSAIGGSLLGGFGKKSGAAPDSASGAGSTAPASAVLYETTTQKSGFSTDAIPATAFQVPAGFTQVTSPDVRPAS